LPINPAGENIQRGGAYLSDVAECRPIDPDDQYPRLRILKSDPLEQGKTFALGRQQVTQYDPEHRVIARRQHIGGNVCFLGASRSVGYFRGANRGK
jgi:hypothetical protein